MSTFLHYVHCKDALLDCSAPGGERCESLTWVDDIINPDVLGTGFFSPYPVRYLQCLNAPAPGQGNEDKESELSNDATRLWHINSFNSGAN